MPQGWFAVSEIAMPWDGSVDVSFPFASRVLKLLLGSPFPLHQYTVMLFDSEVLITQGTS